MDGGTGLCDMVKTTYTHVQVIRWCHCWGRSLGFIGHHISQAEWREVSVSVVMTF